MPAWATLISLLFMMRVGAGQTAELWPPVPDGLLRRVAADVGGRPLLLSAVWETWGPVWEELAGQARLGRLGREQYHHELQREWEKALTGAIRDELFYREARYQIERITERHIAEYMARPGGQGRAAAERAVRQEIQGGLARQMEALRQEAQAAAGGAARLSRNLERQGLSLADWNERLERKAYIEIFFSLSRRPSASNPAPQRIRDFYMEHRARLFTQPGPVLFRHILFSAARRGGMEGARAAGVEIWRRLQSGELAFADAARNHSDDAVSRPAGGLEGDQDPFAASAYDPAREAWLADLRRQALQQEPGELGGLLESAAGYHLLMVERRLPPVVTPFSKAQDDIRRRLAAEDRQRETSALFGRLAREVPVRRHLDAYPPECRWDAILPSGGGPRR